MTTDAKMNWGLILINLVSILPSLIVVSRLHLSSSLLPWVHMLTNDVIIFCIFYTPNVSITCWCWEYRVVLSFCANIFLVSLFIYTKCIYPVKYVLVLVWFWFSYTKCCAFGNIFVPQMPLPITPLDNDNTWFFLLIFL